MFFAILYQASTEDKSKKSVVVGVEGGGFVGEEMEGVEFRLHELELAGSLGEVETIGEVVGERVSIAEGTQIELRLDELQQAAVIVGDMGDVGALGVGRNDDQRNAKAVLARIENGGRDVVVPGAPIVPGLLDRVEVGTIQPKVDSQVGESVQQVPQDNYVCKGAIKEVKMRRHWSLYVLAFALLPGLLSRPAVAQKIGQLVELSRPSAVGSCDTGFHAFGDWPVDEAAEPIVAVNPLHPNNVVAAWIQGPFQNIIAAVSLDGGQTWQSVPIPLTTCSGGPFVGGGDPWLSFAPNGDLYAVAETGSSLSTMDIYVFKSGDGGLHWSAPLVVPGSSSKDPGPSLTADPKDARFVYATWRGISPGHPGTVVFSRTTDGGLTWEPARTIVPPTPQGFIQFSQILVLPNGTLVDIYDFRERQPDKLVINLQVRRSTNRGRTWSAPRNAVTRTPLLRAGLGMTSLVDPKTGQFVLDVTNPSFAEDRRGNLYTVWDDGRFSNFQYPDIAFAMSADGGLKWSAPIRVNQTPVNIPPANRQAFFPSIAVAADGTIGVSYYDFRLNDANPGLPADRWLVLCHPSSAKPATNAANWGSEVRLTDSSFNMGAVVATVRGGFFIGDYFGLATAGNDFVSVFIQPDHDNVTSAFFRRVKQ